MITMKKSIFSKEVDFNSCPAKWGKVKLKFLVKINQHTLPETTRNDLEIEYIDIGNVDKTKGIIETEKYYFEDAPSRARRIVKKGDIIVSTVRTYLQAIAEITERKNNLIVSTGFAVFTPTNIFNRYATYFIKSEYFVNQVMSQSVGVSYPAISPSKLASIKILVPGKNEQRSIAAFLDRETARIDALIEKKQQLIALLKEKRTALITRAVTKGIGALSGAETPKMKPSGIEWLGEIPEHWEVKRLRYLLQITTGEKDTENREENGVYPFYVRSQTVERISTYSYDGEAILTAGDGVGVCKVWHHVNAKFDFHQRVYMLYKFRGVTGRFLFYFLKELFVHEVLKLSAKSTVDSLRLHMFQNFPVAVPNSIIEQRRIGEFLNAKTRKIDDLVVKVNHAIEKLREYRTALISAAVTGKVRMGE
jgi:type I restriction enzyme, S subunit